MPLKLAGISKEAHDEACVTYAALLLADAGAEINADKLAEVVKASGNEVEAYWPTLFAGIISKTDINELIANSVKVGGGGGGGGAGGAGGAAGGAAEEEKEEEEEEEEVDVGGGNLFGEDEGGY
uniref:60S acidic ribosomal protein P1 n=1 Tax=Prorocentrum micans TaxID=2945 RepID=A0A7S2TBF2_PROMC|mmetsp:Transcript_4964/g.6264  ORF Transcript_4964/g.6264 Transcript_4964/m.6264 type:complete len:124 (+) Transcript_4964:241-612(+)|eukprot:CAMPEP_0204822002 /NCGR_PEP_ID=MMETSP1346-20131115/184_1 /ASSEMBLY_ACC=CAM_ASM_000771 /TAXON_ID=215587 /ORGANISM="Aplanochytrium stocchinoi, Strain GSBS06" /LENGTH=123 /DNA_ID=CAMNT_0051948001 /DNA_START=125 /DNA_END=496 /DNA_ORIENTATION=+